VLVVVQGWAANIWSGAGSWLGCVVRHRATVWIWGGVEAWRLGMGWRRGGWEWGDCVGCCSRRQGQVGGVRMGLES
jgi:hypothetical protein